MILSMTGFGEAQLEENGHAYHVEIRSVNNRYFKASLRLPEEFAFLEPEIEQSLRKRMSRGSLTLKLFIRDLSAAAAQDINLAAVRHYMEQLRSVMPSGPGFAIDLATLATLPGVIQPHELSDEQRERAQALVARLTEGAIDRLLEMRSKEGQALAGDLRTHCQVIRENLDAVRARGPTVVDEYRRRLQQRVQQIIAESGVKLGEEDLLKEVAIYAERSDISEEIARLTSHLDQFAQAIDSREPAGRKLDFISQEMLREANTIGSKAGDATIARSTIEIKGAIDRVKEQVQNVE